jgi:rod shape-determining protein MreC
MRMLRPDVFQRRAPAARRRQNAAAIFILALVSVGLLLLSRIEHPAVLKARSALSEALAPVIETVAVFMRPLRPLVDRFAALQTTADEVERLRRENQRLRGWQARAEELERRLADLGALAKAVSASEVGFVTGRVIADARGPFARSALLDAGESSGVRDGHPVISSYGLVGRIVETGSRTARILLLTDLNSRIPILAGPAGYRGIMIGDNGSRPRLAHLADGVDLEEGQAVVTSGVGGIFPRGLSIGEVVRSTDGWRVALHARLDHLDHVSVLFYELPGPDLRRVSAGAAPPPVPRPADGALRSRP